MTDAPARESFSKILPTLQVAWDSTSLGTLKDCPRKYQYSIVEGHMGVGSSLHLRYGILYHRALEVYDHKRHEGMGHDEAMRFSLRDLAEGCMDECPVCHGNGGSTKIPEAPFACNTCPTGGPDSEYPGWGTGRVWWNPSAGLSEKKAEANPKTIPNLFRTVVWYLERFPLESDPCRTITLANGKPAVELSFRFDLGGTFSTGERVVYSGHLDRLVEYNGQSWVMDRKTTSSTIDGSSGYSYFLRYSPDNQMSGYTLGGKVALAQPVVGVIIDAAQIAKGFSRFERGFVMRTEAQLEEWRQDALFWIGQAESFAQQNYWPMNDKSCDKFGGCPFREICAKDPAVRHVYLATGRLERRYWDPLKIRGDI